MNYKKNWHTAGLLAPWLITFLVFWLYPLIYALSLSFTKYYTLTNETVWVGLKNYAKAFSDPVFFKALGNTVLFTFGTVPVTTSLAIILASVLNSKLVRFKPVFQASYFLPSVTSVVVIALIFTNLYSRSGYINLILSTLGMNTPANGWLLSPGWALPAVMIMDIWSATGYYMMLFLAGMQTIPEDLYSAATLSGANAWQKFWRITLPMLRSTLLFVVVINTIKSFQIFVEIYVMTKGGPLDSTTTLVYMVFVNAFEKADAMGYASAIAFILFVILLIMSALQFKLLKAKN